MSTLEQRIQFAILLGLLLFVFFRLNERINTIMLWFQFLAQSHR